MGNQADHWRQLGFALGLGVTAPVAIAVAGKELTFTALLPQLGGRHGIIVDPDWEAIGPHSDELTRLGFGFSAVEIGDDVESAKEMLRDWGWTANEPKPSWW
jgi:hypothetical protein